MHCAQPGNIEMNNIISLLQKSWGLMALREVLHDLPASHNIIPVCHLWIAIYLVCSFWLYWLCQSLCVDHNKLWKILKEMGIPDHLTYLLRNLYVSQEALVRTRHGTTDWFQIEKGVSQSCVLSPCLFNFYAQYIMWNAGLEGAQAGIKSVWRNIITPDIQMTPPLWQKAKKSLRISWWKWKRTVKKLV